jgi:hypothetical protein
MYKNPLNNGDVSDYNSLKKQRDYGAIINKYENIKLKTKPNELQKYYQYLTYQQPILNELNYVAERMRNEDIKTKTDDYSFIEDLKIKREGLMKTNSAIEKDISKDTLFDKSSEIKNDDKTPVIESQLEMEKPIIINNKIKNELITQAKAEMFGDDEFSNLGGLFDDILNNNNKKEEKFELSREGDKEIEKMNKKKKEEEQKEIEKMNKKKKEEEQKEEEKAANKAFKEAERAAKKAKKNRKKKEGRQAKKKNQI